ncbi:MULTISPECIES: acyltransferase [Bacillaceae]|uniref:Acyltransferase n=1 Tax=Evansella alkalicola TaxID=745819 RepID=A0ABS6JWW7_9BACI|nr:MULTISPECIES: acyltransferase [Bacillaceae]MBU9723064.1 acyltransferase [Bacillus alkalicola]
MTFRDALDKILGKRKLFHVIECSVCGFNEVYYIDPFTNKQLGKACETCNHIQRFEFDG